MAGEFLTIKEVASILRMSPNCIGDWIRSGKIPAVQPHGTGGVWLILKSEVDKIIEKARNTNEQ